MHHIRTPIAAQLTAPAALQNAERLDSEIIYNRDFEYDYFGFKACPLLFEYTWDSAAAAR